MFKTMTRATVQRWPVSGKNSQPIAPCAWAMMGAVCARRRRYSSRSTHGLQEG